MAKVGYARVSTLEQDLNSQLSALSEAGCEEIFAGKQSGSSKQNELKLEELLRYIRKGDVVIVTKLDRLGRSLKSILKTIDAIHAKSATLITIDGSINTSDDSPMAKAFRALLGIFAELERDLIVSRTSEGREYAKKQGRRFGPPIKITDEIKKSVLRDLNNNKGVVETAKNHGISHTSVGRIKKESIDAKKGH